MTITSPASSSLPGPEAEVVVEVDAQDEGWGVAKVSLEIAGMVEAVDDEPPFVFPAASFPEGTWEIVAIAEDAVGQSTRSEAVTLEVGGDAATGGGDPDGEGCGCRSGAAPGAW